MNAMGVATPDLDSRMFVPHWSAENGGYIFVGHVAPFVGIVMTQQDGNSTWPVVIPPPASVMQVDPPEKSPAFIRSAGTRTLTPDIVDALLREANKDIERARQLARERGYRVE